MARVANFTAGPAALPLPVLERARDELLDFEGSGMSIMENSHRSKTYEKVHDEAIARLKVLLAIPAGYQVLFLQGGASQQFVMVPWNLLPPGKSADYILSGHWSERALKEAQALGKARVAGSTQELGYTRVPAANELSLDGDAAYCHFTTNNTIYGTQWPGEPDTGKVPLVADASSDILSRRIDVSRYGLLYAGAQKNLGPSGVTLVIIRDDLVAAGRKDLPTYMRYETHAKNNSLYNTPPTFAIYLVNLVLGWIEAEGGLGAMERRNDDKAKRLYAAIEARPDYYRCPVETASRSKMNVVFRLPSEALEEQFVQEATRAGMVGLKGHRSVGGIRASLYNAVSPEDVARLTDFMDGFARANPA
jgi:phosphoserine aminotransferase